MTTMCQACPSSHSAALNIAGQQTGVPRPPTKTLGLSWSITGEHTPHMERLKQGCRVNRRASATWQHWDLTSMRTGAAQNTTQQCWSMAPIWAPVAILPQGGTGTWQLCKQGVCTQTQWHWETTCMTIGMLRIPRYGMCENRHA